MYYGYGILASNGINTEEIIALSEGDIKAVFIEEEPLAILCSLTDSAKPTVAGVRHYNKCLCHLIRSNTIIPLRFGTVFNTEDEIHDVLRKNKKKYLKLLDTFNRAFEVELKVYWEKETFQSTILSHKRLARWKHALERGDGRGYDLVEFGRAVQETADQERKRIVKTATALLNPLARKIIQKDCTSELEAFYGIYLIERDKEEQFDEAVGQLASDLGTGFHFKYTGPWPVHHFIE